MSAGRSISLWSVSLASARDGPSGNLITEEPTVARMILAANASLAQGRSRPLCGGRPPADDPGHSEILPLQRPRILEDRDYVCRTPPNYAGIDRPPHRDDRRMQRRGWCREMEKRVLTAYDELWVAPKERCTAAPPTLPVEALAADGNLALATSAARYVVM